MRPRRVLAASPEETARLGAELGAAARPGECLALVGELGAGKTTFVQGLARGLGVAGPVSSPSFLIVQEHRGRLPLFHVDAYRLGSAGELDEIGFEEYLAAGGVVAVEWADRVVDRLPAEARWITFALHGETARAIVVGAERPGPAG